MADFETRRVDAENACLRCLVHAAVADLTGTAVQGDTIGGTPGDSTVANGYLFHA